MARHGKQRQPQLRGHMGDKAGFAAAGGAFDQHRQLLTPGVGEHLALVAGRLIKRDIRCGHVQPPYRKLAHSPPHNSASQPCTAALSHIGASRRAMKDSMMTTPLSQAPPSASAASAAWLRHSARAASARVNALK